MGRTDLCHHTYRMAPDTLPYLSLPFSEAPVDGSISLSEHFERKSKTNDLFQYVFKSVAGKKGHVTLDDVMNWDFTQVLGSSFYPTLRSIPLCSFVLYHACTVNVHNTERFTESHENSEKQYECLE